MAGESELPRSLVLAIAKGISQMQLSHGRPVGGAVFDEANLVSAAGLVPVAALARDAGLRTLSDEHLSVPTDKGANAGLKVASLVAGMVAGADSIDDMAPLRHGGMGRVFDACYAPIDAGLVLAARSRSGTCVNSTRSPPGCWARSRP